jgi:hypothetical protein
VLAIWDAGGGDQLRASPIRVAAVMLPCCRQQRSRHRPSSSDGQRANHAPKTSPIEGHRLQVFTAGLSAAAQEGVEGRSGIAPACSHRPAGHPTAGPVRLMRLTDFDKPLVRNPASTSAGMAAARILGGLGPTSKMMGRKFRRQAFRCRTGEGAPVVSLHQAFDS